MVKAFVSNCKVPAPVWDMLLNDEPPEFKVCMPAALVKVTVFDPGVNVPPVFDQFPETLNVPDSAVNVPLLNVTSVTETVAAEPVNVPPETTKFPPVRACPLVSSVPAETVSVPVYVVGALRDTVLPELLMVMSAGVF